jgi:hypothetical protein
MFSNLIYTWHSRMYNWDSECSMNQITYMTKELPLVHIALMTDELLFVNLGLSDPSITDLILRKLPTLADQKLVEMRDLWLEVKNRGREPFGEIYKSGNALFAMIENGSKKIPYEITVVMRESIPADWCIWAGRERWMADDYAHLNRDDLILHARIVPEFDFCRDLITRSHAERLEIACARRAHPNRQTEDWPMFDGNFKTRTNQSYIRGQDVYGTPSRVMDCLRGITDPAGNC